MGQCPNGHISPNNTQGFCSICGETLIQTCPNGHPNRRNARFCPTCGVTMEVTQPTPLSNTLNPPRKSHKGLLVAIGVGLLVLVLAISAAILLTRHSSTSNASSNTSTSTSTSTSTTAPTGASAQVQASALTGLLQSGTQVRSELQSAIDAVQGSVGTGAGCQSNVATAVSQLQQVVSSRQTLLDQLSTLSLSAVPNGALVVHDLRSSWLISKRIDADFSQWANVELNSNCGASDASVVSYQATNVLDPRSTQMKITFVNLWDPIASQLNQPSTWTAAQI